MSQASPDTVTTTQAAPAAQASGCHGGAAEMQKAARAAGKSDTLERYAADYPKGPHDQPQSMCPAFGSLRVGLRMRRTMTILSGSACCVYGLTFTSHFYGARRSVEAYVLARTDLDLNGEQVVVEFVERLRPTLRFDSVDALVARMHQDVEGVRDVLAGAAG